MTDRQRDTLQHLGATVRLEEPDGTVCGHRPGEGWHPDGQFFYVKPDGRLVSGITHLTAAERAGLPHRQLRSRHHPLQRMGYHSWGGVPV